LFGFATPLPGLRTRLLIACRDRGLRGRLTRAQLGASTDHIKTKIANAEQMKVHTMLVIGNRDLEAGAVSVRVHGQGNLGAKEKDEAIAEILLSIKERRAV
jgi:threonyl-tRNA synthetase